MPLFPEQLRSDEIDETLSPTCFLHHQQPAFSIHDMPDRRLLSVTEGSRRVLGTEPQQLKRVSWVIIFGQTLHADGQEISESQRDDNWIQ